MDRSSRSARRDFDFLMGRWLVHHRQAAHHKPRGATVWIEFETVAEARPLLGGLGSLDLHAGTLPDRSPFEAMSFRLYDPGRRLWRSWWASTAGPGRLQPPVEGRFSDGHGRFFGSDVVDGDELLVRIDWTAVTATSARWERSVSRDGGRTWQPDGIMEWTRLERPISHLAEARRRALIMAQEVKGIARALPRTHERIVRNQVKFKVGSIVYVALSRDETAMGFSFPKEARAALVKSAPEKFFMPAPADMRYNWVELWLDNVDLEELRELVIAAWRMVVPKRVASEYLRTASSAGSGRQSGLE